jgi:hypothetical protein
MGCLPMAVVIMHVHKYEIRVYGYNALHKYEIKIYGYNTCA